MDVGAYKAVTKPLAIDFEGEVINITYRPNVYTLGFQRSLVEALEDQSGEALAMTFGELIASWDLLENGVPLPLTSEGIEKVPLTVLGAIDQAIGETLQVPSEEEKRGLSEPSALLPPTSTPPLSGTPSTDPSSSNGSETLESQTVSAVDRTS